MIVGLFGGLGNRLAALYSTYNLKIKYKIKVKYHWPNSFDCGCKFSDLFSNKKLEISNFDIQNIKKKTDQILKKEEIYQDIFWITPMYATLEGDDRKTGRVFADSFNKITINKQVLDRVNSVAISNPRIRLSDVIGIHVRGGDLKKGKIAIEDQRKYVKPEVFFVEIEKILKKEKNQKFFLSCENVEDEIKFLSKYNQNIIKLENCVRERNNKQGAVDGFANIILLSKCSEIIGTSSSFSEVASYISGINKNTLGVKKIKFY